MNAGVKTWTNSHKTGHQNRRNYKGQHGAKQKKYQKNKHKDNTKTQTALKPQTKQRLENEFNKRQTSLATT